MEDIGKNLERELRDGKKEAIGRCGKPLAKTSAIRRREKGFWEILGEKLEDLGFTVGLYVRSFGDLNFWNAYNLKRCLRWKEYRLREEFPDLELPFSYSISEELKTARRIERALGLPYGQLLRRKVAEILADEPRVFEPTKRMFKEIFHGINRMFFQSARAQLEERANKLSEDDVEVVDASVISDVLLDKYTGMYLRAISTPQYIEAIAGDLFDEIGAEVAETYRRILEGRGEVEIGRTLVGPGIAELKRLYLSFIKSKLEAPIVQHFEPILSTYILPLEKEPSEGERGQRSEVQPPVEERRPFMERHPTLYKLFVRWENNPWRTAALNLYLD